jgi:hypothetical protein
MGLTRCSKAILKVLTVLLLDSCLTFFAQAQNQPLAPAEKGPIETVEAPAGKTFAVFVAAYNPLTGQARGGVAGTAFFISKNKAITAYHVLQAQSFVPPEGFTQVQVWLVHENEAAIELNFKNLSPHKEIDLTFINLNQTTSIAEKYILKVGHENSPEMRPAVHTEGFLANSVGPLLKRGAGQRLEITSVPKLVRLRANGALLQSRLVNLQASDVRLHESACYQLSYQPVVGLSGGPVLDGDEVIAMNSFADPNTRGQTWAINLEAMASIFL